MKKGKIIIIGILVLCLILAVSVMSFNKFSKKGLLAEHSETVNDILQDEEEFDAEGDTEVIFDDSEFVGSESNGQSEQENTKYSEKSKNSSDETGKQNPSNQDTPEQIESSDGTQAQEQEKESDKKELWTGYY